ncbi:MAG: MarR family transcriptional regulator [Sandaracinaceae bacterium]|nr:MarR family transcriptional regulator [Sandaracinaceae bacterium]
MDPQQFARELEAQKRASTAQLLMRCARLVNERGVARAAQKFGIPVRAAHMGLFPHLDLAGTRQTELARRMGVSKQAVNQLVAELVGFGVLEQVPDPADGRALLVRFTPRGAQSLFDGLTVLSELEVTMRGALGAARMDALHDTLTQLSDWLDDPA